MVVTEGDMIKLDEFVHLYHLKESKEYGYYELVPWVKKARIVIDLPSSFQYWKSKVIPLSCVLLKLRKRVCLLPFFFFFFIYFYFFIIFLPCIDDNQIQPRDVCQDEG